MLVVGKAVEIVKEKAKKSGFAIAGTFNTNTSSGAIGYYASRLAAEGLIGLAFSRSPLRVAFTVIRACIRDQSSGHCYSDRAGPHNPRMSQRRPAESKTDKSLRASARHSTDGSDDVLVFECSGNSESAFFAFSFTISTASDTAWRGFVAVDPRGNRGLFSMTISPARRLWDTLVDELHHSWLLSRNWARRSHQQ